MFDLGSHLVDQVYVLFGMPRCVYGKLVDSREGRLDLGRADSVTALLTYPSGMLAHVRIGVMSVEKQQPRFWIRGTKGSFRKAGLDPQEDQLKRGMSPLDAGFGVEGEEWAGVLTTVGDDGVVGQKSWPSTEVETYGKVLEGFAAAIRTGRREDVPVRPEEAVDVLVILEAIMESARTGAEVNL